MIGFQHPLYILPFDHRDSFISGVFHWQEPLTAVQIAQVAAAKRAIWDGFQAAVAMGVPRDRAGILVDEQFGAAILHEARQAGLLTAVAVERSGQQEFQFEYGADFARHIEIFDPTFAKVLVRYNPSGAVDLNRRQAVRLRELSTVVHAANRRFMLELLVPAERAQLEDCHGDERVYEREFRPALMVEAIGELQDQGVEPDVWKVEGMDHRVDYERVVARARRGERAGVGCIILGQGVDEGQVLAWLKLAASVPGFIGFAVGRTTWWDPIVAWQAREVSRAEAVQRIASDYREWVDIFERGRAS